MNETTESPDIETPPGGNDGPYEALIELKRQQRLYEAITRSTPDLIYVFGLDYRFTYANEALLQMWGRTAEDAYGKSLLEIGYEPWHAEMHEREIDQVVATRQPIRGEVPFVHHTLGRRIYDYIFVPVLNEAGDVEAVAGTTRDVTERKQAEESIREASELKDQFISLVSHELRTPITTILGNASLLTRRWQLLQEEDRQQALQDTLAEAGRLQSIVENLLLLSRLDASHDLSFSELPLGTLLSEQIEAFKHRHPERQVEFETAIEDEARIQGQSELISMLISNLIGNAHKYSPIDSAIEVALKRTASGQVLVQVSDHGIGFDEEDLPSLFTPFFRTNEGRHHASGMGLGLAVCKRIIEAHKGSIWAERRAEGGAIFCFTMPVESVF